MTDAQQAIEAYINLTDQPKAMELWALVEQHGEQLAHPPTPLPSTPTTPHREEP